jgi:hypothetical protein
MNWHQGNKKSPIIFYITFNGSVNYKYIYGVLKFALALRNQ